MRTGIKLAVVAILAGVVVLFVAWDGSRTEAFAYHSSEELSMLRAQAEGDLPLGYNTFFVASGECSGCHGHDQQGLANVDTAGVDINVVDDWRSTMMANSARDPFWRAKVSHETLVNPDHAEVLENKCTSCHAPMANFDKHLTGGGNYSIAELETDSMALDGVSCAACHMMSGDSIGDLFSGDLIFDTAKVEGVGNLYGPYLNVLTAPMLGFVSYEPKYGEHISDAGLCAGCHTLITETADLDGNLTGDEFTEQGTYHEWLNSIYNDDVTCQECHIPQTNQPVILSANYAFLPGQRPYGLHHLAGANTFMLKMLKEHIDELDIPATEAQFDSTIARTERMLQERTLELELNMTSRDLDTAFIDLELENYAGHKFPSGYPARRAWVQFVVTNALNDTLFASGILDDQYEVIGHDAEFEPHYDMINDPNQVQIYEMVMGDVNGDKTTVLERAQEPIKDNRLVPFGFTTTHFSYDTVKYGGAVLLDDDFNLDDMGIEGSGTDVISYHVPLNNYTGTIYITAKVLYQSAPPLWLDEMFSYNSAEIDTFRNMYFNQDNTPDLVKEISISDVSDAVDDLNELGVHLFPNPSPTGAVNLTGLGKAGVQEISLYDLSGKLIQKFELVKTGVQRIQLPEQSGVYLIEVVSPAGNFVERVVRL